MPTQSAAPLSAGKVLVTGANGFVGSAVLRQLSATGFQCVGTTRNPSNGTIAIGNMSRHTDWSAALEGCGAVVHAAARAHQVELETDDVRAQFHEINTEVTLNLARQAAASGVGRFIFLSSIKAMGEAGHFSAATPCSPQDAYGRSKLAAEEGLHEIARKTGMEIVILRLPLVYGPGVKANFLALFKLVESGIPLPLAGVQNARSMLGLNNLVDLIAACLVNPGAAGKTFLPSDGPAVSTAVLIKAVANSLGRSARLFYVPTPLLRLVARLTGKSGLADRLLGNLSVDSSPLQAELGWVPPFTLEANLEETARWYKSRGAAGGTP